MYTLYGRPGWGSVIAEAQLVWYGLPFRMIEVGDLFASAEAREELQKVNPLAQLPTLLLPDGRLMTESAAITLHLADVAGSTELVPPPDAPERPVFLRWLIFLVANIYPTFTYADEPTRFVPEACAQAFRANVDAYSQRLWGMVAAEARQPWFLGERFSAMDIFIAAMTRWRPRRGWFAKAHPQLHALALRAEAKPRLVEVLRRNFPES
jgi:GST-like protein